MKARRELTEAADPRDGTEMRLPGTELECGWPNKEVSRRAEWHRMSLVQLQGQQELWTACWVSLRLREWGLGQVMGGLCTRQRHLDTNGLWWETTGGFLSQEWHDWVCIYRKTALKGACSREWREVRVKARCHEGWSVGGLGQRANSYVYLRS